MLRRTYPVSITLAVLGILAGCDLFESPVEPDVAHLLVQLIVDPETVHPGDPFVIRLEMRNTGRDTAAVVAEAECFASLVVRREPEGAGAPERVEPYFESGARACWSVPSSRLDLAPGELVAHTWPLQALHADSSELEAGKYQVLVDLEGRLDRLSVLPDIQRSLVVEQPEVE